jgi:RNA polymerase sigma factor (sigma-70 family)
MTGVSDDRALWLSENVLPHEPALRVWLTHRRIVGLDVDDIIQETYAKLAALDSVANIRHPKSYVFQTAYSIIVTHIRRSRVISIRAINEIDLLSLSSDDASPERQLDDREQLQRLAQARLNAENAALAVLNHRLAGSVNFVVALGGGRDNSRIPQPGFFYKLPETTANNGPQASAVPVAAPQAR